MRDKYKRDGTPYPEGVEGLFEWSRDLQDDRGRIVKQELLPNGYWVSTVWLGLDHKDDAILGHLRAVDHFKDKTI